MKAPPKLAALATPHRGARQSLGAAFRVDGLPAMAHD